MILTLAEILKLKLELASKKNEQAISNETVLRDLVDDDKDSKRKLEMKTGVEYYAGEHAIKDKTQYFWVGTQRSVNKTRANNKVTNTFLADLIDQKVAYVAGNPIDVIIKGKTYAIEKAEAKLLESVDNALGNAFDNTMLDWLENCSAKGEEWLQIFINEQGDFGFTTADAIEIIPIYDSKYETELEQLIRYYPAIKKNEKGEDVVLIKAEWWTKDDVTYYIEQENERKEKVFVKDTSEAENPSPHYWILNGDKKTGASWKRVPFVRLKNNSKMFSDLKRIKSLVDIYDKVESGFADNLEDIQEAIWILRGYEGTDLNEFAKNLQLFKTIAVDSEGGVDTKTNEIPSEAREKILTRLEKNIYKFGQGVNMSDENFAGNASGVALKFKFALLDIKANKLIVHLKDALNNFLWFVVQYINFVEKTSYKSEVLECNISKTFIVNEKEIIENIIASQNQVSEQTLLERHPYVDDVEEELRRLAEQREKENEVNFDNLEKQLQNKDNEGLAI